MQEIIKPTIKGKFDGSVDYLTSDEARFLIIRGDYTEEEILKAAIEQNIIDDDDCELWRGARYYQSWYKVSPIGGQQGYSNWHHPRDTPCRGAYFASVLEWS